MSWHPLSIEWQIDLYSYGNLHIQQFLFVFGRLRSWIPFQLCIECAITFTAKNSPFYKSNKSTQIHRITYFKMLCHCCRKTCSSGWLVMQLLLTAVKKVKMKADCIRIDRELDTIVMWWKYTRKWRTRDLSLNFCVWWHTQCKGKNRQWYTNFRVIFHSFRFYYCDLVNFVNNWLM